MNLISILLPQSLETAEFCLRASQFVWLFYLNVAREGNTLVCFRNSSVSTASLTIYRVQTHLSVRISLILKSFSLVHNAYLCVEFCFHQLLAYVKKKCRQPLIIYLDPHRCKIYKIYEKKGKKELVSLSYNLA